jgi:HSP20 family protein
LKSKKLESKISVRAEVPGFAAGEIKINVEPNLLVISGKSESAVKEANEQTVFSEFHSNQFSRQLPLPSEVDPAKATAVLKNGILEIELVRTRATCGRQG